VFGFTRQEKIALLFLIITFLIGTGIWSYRKYLAPLPDIQQARNVTVQERSEDSKERDPLEADQDSTIFIVSINHADQQEFEQLPGIGPVIAKRIIDTRTELGKFSSIDNLIQVKGIGRKTLEKLKPYLSL
jgi:comEA protein